MRKEYLMKTCKKQKELITDGFEKEMFLSEYEKMLKEKHYRTHQDLTAFLSLISGVDKKTAEDNIRRIKQIVEKEILDGISSYFSDRKFTSQYLSDAELKMRYDHGIYECGMSFFDVEKRYPRKLAVEDQWFFRKTFLKVEEKICVFSLKVRDLPYIKEKTFWYSDRGKWRQVRDSEGYLEIPAHSFRFTFFPAERIVEAECLVAFTGHQDASVSISEEECRELNIHIW